MGNGHLFWEEPGWDFCFAVCWELSNDCPPLYVNDISSVYEQTQIAQIIFTTQEAKTSAGGRLDQD